MTKKTPKAAERLASHFKVESLECEPVYWLCKLKPPYRTQQGKDFIRETSLGAIEDLVKDAREWAPEEITTIPASEVPAWIGSDVDATGMDPDWVRKTLNDPAMEDYLILMGPEALDRLWRDEQLSRLPSTTTNPLRQVLDDFQAQGKLKPTGGQ